MAAARGTRSPPEARPTITAAASRRIVIRVPYCRDMRARLTRCGGTPRWEPEHAVWTMPQATLSAVVAEVVAAFGAGLVRIEVADGAGSLPALPAQAGHILQGTPDETLQQGSLQELPVRRVRSMDRAGHVWLSYELTAPLPALAPSPC